MAKSRILEFEYMQDCGPSDLPRFLLSQYLPDDILESEYTEDYDPSDSCLPDDIADLLESL